jgi:ribosomal protein L37AE/L43A
MSNELLKPVEADTESCSECGSDENETFKEYHDGTWVCCECAHNLPQGSGWSPTDKYE